MPAKKDEPYRKICVSLPESFVSRLERYPGTTSGKIQLLCEYAMEMGCMMTIDEAREKAGPKLVEAIRTSRKVPSLFARYLKESDTT